MKYFLTALGSIIAWILKKLGFAVVRTNIYLGISAISWAIYLNTMVFGIYLGLSFVNMVQSGLTIFNSFVTGGSGSGCVGSTVGYIFSCSGVYNGLSSGLPLFTSSITFLCLVFVHNASLNLRDKLQKQAYQAMNLYMK